MRLAISNIAWDITEDEAVVELLNSYGVDAIDIAPGKYFPQPANATLEEMSSVKAWWNKRGIEITGMQALLFGTTGLNVFGSVESQDALLQHLDGVCRIGAGLGAPRLVFGSPKNRDRSGLSDAETESVAFSFFNRLGDIAASHGVMICLEPNPICYGANFMTTSAETAQVVSHIAHPAIRMQFDTGALAINNEDPTHVLQDCAHLIGHVHASEPNLLPLGNGGTDHEKMFTALAQYLPHHLVSIEMVATKDEPHLVSIERALNVAIKHYRKSEFVANS
jgi:D-psicose/D-tagatose/L-ribulose 3-epimerase